MNTSERLQALVVPGDEAYIEFNRRIITTGYEMLGVRTPALRSLARQIAANPRVDDYLYRGITSDSFYEEVMLYGMVLAVRARHMPLEDVFTLFERLVPLFDNWAHVDVVVSGFKLFARHRDEVFRRFLPLKTHPGEFARRTFVVLLMDYFLDETCIERTLAQFADVPQGQYYVDMALAWALAEALVRHYDLAEPLFRRPVFSRFVHNKAIQKARESLRITPDRKEHLLSLKQP